MSFTAATMPIRRHVNRASSAAMAAASSAFVAKSARSPRSVFAAASAAWRIPSAMASAWAALDAGRFELAGGGERVEGGGSHGVPGAQG